jgi:DNA-binding response OmpR family regulator
MKILIVDDEPHIRQMMRLTLEASAYEVGEAANGEEGLARFGDGGEWAAVLLDQKMPGLDGLETLRQMKARVAEACVVMVTAFASIELAVDAMRLGATDFLRKPMTPEMLRGAVAAALASRPRTPVRSAGALEERPSPRIETLTLNGFRIVRPQTAPDLRRGEHVFEVTHFPDGAAVQVTVRIDPEAVARVARLSRRQLQAGGAFWREQAERVLSAYLWSEGRMPESGELTVHDVSREDLDVAAAWDLD